jgi:hypothetical protein
MTIIIGVHVINGKVPDKLKAVEVANFTKAMDLLSDLWKDVVVNGNHAQVTVVAPNKKEFIPLIQNFIGYKKNPSSLSKEGELY